MNPPPGFYEVNFVGVSWIQRVFVAITVLLGRTTILRLESVTL